MNSDKGKIFLLLLGITIVFFLFLYRFNSGDFQERLSYLESRVHKHNTDQLLNTSKDNNSEGMSDAGLEIATAVYTYPGELRNPFGSAAVFSPEQATVKDDKVVEDSHKQVVSVQEEKKEYRLSPALVKAFKYWTLRGLLPVKNNVQSSATGRPLLQGIGYHNHQRVAILKLGPTYYVVGEGEKAGGYEVYHIADRHLLLLKDYHILKIEMGGQES